MNDFKLFHPFGVASTGGEQNSNNPTISVADLEDAFQALGEEIFQVDVVTGNIIWMSPACATLSHKLGSSKNLAEFPALKNIIYAALPEDNGSKTRSLWHTNDSTWEQYIGSHSKASISVYCGQNNRQLNTAWVRLTRYSDREDYLRKYVAEQEELFNTSKSVSVGEIATTLAHELNQPLGTLLNIVNGIKVRVDDTHQHADEIYKALELAEKQAQFASEILLRIRSFSQARQPVIGRFNAKQLIDETLGLLDWKFQRQGVNTSFSISDENMAVRCDNTLLQQVLVNLLRNAVESMANVPQEKRIISIAVKRKNSAVSIDISDAGHGIDVTKMDELFTLFRSSKPNGMGVGLNICLSFIELHQGKFWFTQNDRCGSTAHIVLPD